MYIETKLDGKKDFMIKLGALKQDQKYQQRILRKIIWQYMEIRKSDIDELELGLIYILMARSAY